jgi:hypothetical protein
MAPRQMLAALLALALAACTVPKTLPDRPPPTKGFPGGAQIHDSAYRAVERGEPPPAGYGLYTVLLTRTANRNSVRLLSELFAVTGSTEAAALARENLNLIAIPVNNSGEAARAMTAARESPEPTASAVLNKFYDFGQAALLLSRVCRPEQGAAVMKVCGSAMPDGPLLVTGQRPFDPAAAPGQRLLIVNLGNASPGAVGEIVAAYRRQIQRKDITSPDPSDGWRLAVLNVALDAAQLLPGISKITTASK